MKTSILVYDKDGKNREIAEKFKDATIVDISKIEDIPEDTEILGMIVPIVSGNIPLKVAEYIRDEIAMRNNSKLGYIWAILTYEEKPLWSESHLSRYLSDAGCVLSYVDKVKLPLDAEGNEKLDRIMKDIEKEEFKLAKYSLLYRIFRNAHKPQQG